jgi:hypothetical protein
MKTEEEEAGDLCPKQKSSFTCWISRAAARRRHKQKQRAPGNSEAVRKDVDILKLNRMYIRKKKSMSFIEIMDTLAKTRLMFLLSPERA